MEERELNRATIGVVNRTDIRGRATADEMNRGLRTEKERSFWRIASLTFLGSLTVAGLFVAVVPMPVRADDDENSRHGHEDNDRGLRAEITALQAQLASLQSTVSALQDQVNSLQTSNTTLHSQLVAVQSNHALLLGPFVSVDPNPEIGVVGPHITFTGANIHIVSGSGMTNDNGNPRGLGNLIIGYDEDPVIFLPPGTIGGIIPLRPGDRGGSHNLVIGRANKFTQAAFGGIVAGELNTISNEATSVSGGFENTASGNQASVSGGGVNTASGYRASVSGGFDNTARGGAASVSGGQSNTASGDAASVSGGLDNTASVFGAAVSGGGGDTAGGIGTVVIGGQNVTDNNNNSIAPQPPFP
jgi:trimeric autotransporter adhesin